MKRNGRHPGGDPDATHPLETVLEHVSAESVDPDDAAREESWARALRRKVDTQLAALRRQLMPRRPAPRPAASVSDELLALGRDALLARLEILRQAPDVLIAHLDVSELTTDDLRQLIAEIEAEERTQA